MKRVLPARITTPNSEEASETLLFSPFRVEEYFVALVGGSDLDGCV